MVNSLLRVLHSGILIGALAGCVGSLEIWTPDSPPRVASWGLAEPAVDSTLLADLLAVNVQESYPKFSSRFVSVEVAWPSSLIEGPFFFESETNLAVVASAPPSDEMLHRLAQYAPGMSILYFSLDLSNWPNSLGVGRPREIEASGGNSQGKVTLSPATLASELARFETWAGAHFDASSGRLTLLGTDDPHADSAISVTDLITAYRAIFIHEASGQALFVDMDPGDAYDEYIVSFGGGFEDTHIGDVLFQGDVLLKALSSGVDPWTQAEPLVGEMCRSRRKTPFQKGFCEVVIPYAGESQNGLEFVEAAVTNYFERYFVADLIVGLAGSADESSQDCWKYVFQAGPDRKQRILREIETKGNFDLNSNFFCQAGSGADDTREAVQQIFDLSTSEKSIVVDARKLEDEDLRRSFAELSFASPELRTFLRRMRPTDLTRVLKNMQRLEELLVSDEDSSGLIAKIAVFHLLSKEASFLESFLAMSNVDQVTISYVAANMLLDSNFTAFVRNLHFYQPLCGSGRSIERVSSGTDAYVRFVCTHLAEFPRSYLADQIRAELQDPSLYQTASEIDSDRGWTEFSEPSEVRYWFYPGNESVHFSEDLRTMLFNDTRLEARAERLGGPRLGPYRGTSLDYVGPGGAVTGLYRNLQIINDNYHVLGKIFPTLNELRMVVKVLSFFRWIRDYHASSFDLEAFSIVMESGSPTARNYPVFETAIALPDGVMLRSRGGIDLHSETRVRRLSSEFNSIQSSIDESDKDGRFSIAGRSFYASNAREPTPQTRQKPLLRWRRGDKTIELYTGTRQWELRWRADNKLTKRQSQFLHPNYGVVTEVLAINPKSGAQRIVRVGGVATEQWDLSLNSDGVVAVNTYNNRVAENDQVVQDLCLMLVEQQPEPLSAVFVSLHRGVSILRLQDGYLLRNVDHDASARIVLSDDNCAVESVDAATAAKVATQHWSRVLGSNQHQRLIALELLSTNDGINVKVQSANEEISIPLDRWRSFITEVQDRELADLVFGEAVGRDSRTVTFVRSASYSPGLSGVSAEVQNIFTTDSAAQLRLRIAQGIAGLPSDVTIALSSFDDDRISVRQWGTASKRMLVVDPRGVRKRDIDAIRSVLASVRGTSVMFLPVGGLTTTRELESPEVLWLTGLSQSEVSGRLREAAHSGMLDKIGRIRILNFQNSITSITSLAPEIRFDIEIGAWPQYIRLDTALKLAIGLLDGPTLNLTPLDKAIANWVQNELRETSRSNSIRNLRGRRELMQLNVSWVELVRPQTPYWHLDRLGYALP